MKKIVTLGATIAALVFFLAACSNNSTKSNEKVLAVGSTALQPLAEQAGQQFQDKNPSISIQVQGGGSGAGLSQVAAGSVQIGNSDIFAQQGKNIDASKLVDNKIAVVGIAPVVNKDTKVKNVSQKQLIDIFTGKITNWKQVGGANEKIVVINRAQGSGTRVTFEKFALNGTKTKTSQEQDANGTVQKIVASTPGAISYLAFSYLKGDNLQSLSIDNVKPTEENVMTNAWKIWSYEHMYTKQNPTATTKKFINYMLSDDVQNKFIKKLGYLPIDSMKVTKDHNGNVVNK